MGHVIDIEKVELVKTTIIIILFWICGGKVYVFLVNLVKFLFLFYLFFIFIATISGE